MWVVGLYKEEGVTKGFLVTHWRGSEVSLQEKLSPDSKSFQEYLARIRHFYYSFLAVLSAFSLLFVFVCDPYWVDTRGALDTVLGHFWKEVYGGAALQESEPAKASCALVHLAQ